MMRRALLLHGRGGSPNGTVRGLAQKLRPWLDCECVPMLHADPQQPLSESVKRFEQTDSSAAVWSDPTSLLIGISMGGLVAAHALQSGYAGTVLTISSPTWVDDRTRLRAEPSSRLVALYGTDDDVIRGRTDWPSFTPYAHAVPWLDHDTDRHLSCLTYLISGLLARGPEAVRGGLEKLEDADLDAA